MRQGIVKVETEEDDRRNAEEGNEQPKKFTVYHAEHTLVGLDGVFRLCVGPLKIKFETRLAIKMEKKRLKWGKMKFVTAKNSTESDAVRGIRSTFQAFVEYAGASNLLIGGRQYILSIWVDGEKKKSQ